MRGLPGRFRDDVDDPREGVGAPDGGSGASYHLDLLDVRHVRGHEIPEDQTEEVQIDGPSVHEGELGVGENARGLPAGEVEVASRGLDDVLAGKGSEEIADALGG